MPGELEMLETIRAGLVMPPVEDSNPRPYQQELVDRAVEHFRTHSSGWLLMACGTGKTKTSYWIMKRFLDRLLDLDLDRRDALFIVVTPYLQILRQFHSCWASMNRMHKLSVITGIVASCTDVFGKDRYSNFEYLATARDIRRFLGYTSPKIVFTTYASLSKLKHLRPDLVIYDEAHHVSGSHLFQGQGEGEGAGAGAGAGAGGDVTRSLYLTATPRGAGQVIGAYNLRNAIDDRYLTPYKVSIMQGMSVTECLSYIGQHNSKTIVYATNNAVSRELWRLWCEQLGDEEGIYYLDCKTPRRTREEILDDFSSRDKAIIFNCSVLGEGVDLPSCDSILIYSGYSTEVRITQAMGRPLRLHRGKELANIYLIDDKKTDLRILGMSKYDPEVYNHVQCLGVYDD
jgi:superfamily II DNA or RNA helicase